MSVKLLKFGLSDKDKKEAPVILHFDFKTQNMNDLNY